MTDASQVNNPAERLTFEYVDLPELKETFADSVQALSFDGHNLRIEFCVSRLDERKNGERPRGKRYPACRLVLSAQGTLDLIDRIKKINAALGREAVVKAKADAAAAVKNVPQ
jgi:hypothetical protein